MRRSPRGLREVTGRSGTPCARPLGPYAERLRPPGPHKATRAGEEFRDSGPPKEPSPRSASGDQPARSFAPRRPPPATAANHHRRRRRRASPLHPPRIPLPRQKNARAGSLTQRISKEGEGRGGGGEKGGAAAERRPLPPPPRPPAVGWGRGRSRKSRAEGRLARVGRGAAHARRPRAPCGEAAARGTAASFP